MGRINISKRNTLRRRNINKRNISKRNTLRRRNTHSRRKIIKGAL